MNGQVLTDRELHFGVQLTQTAIGAVRLGGTFAGYWLHWPDLAVPNPDGVIVYEVELTPKSRIRSDAIVRAWAWADDLERRVYLCPPSTPTQQVASSAIGRVRAGDVVRVVELRREGR
jgi:hypothetical protein